MQKGLLIETWQEEEEEDEIRRALFGVHCSYNQRKGSLR